MKKNTQNLETGEYYKCIYIFNERMSISCHGETLSHLMNLIHKFIQDRVAYVI
jgi:hypothetical protein